MNLLVHMEDVFNNSNTYMCYITTTLSRRITCHLSNNIFDSHIIKQNRMKTQGIRYILINNTIYHVNCKNKIKIAKALKTTQIKCYQIFRSKNTLHKKHNSNWRVKSGYFKKSIWHAKTRYLKKDKTDIVPNINLLIIVYGSWNDGQLIFKYSP